MNGFKTVLLLSAMTALLMGIGYAIGGPGGTIVALLAALAMNLVTFWNADRIVLSMHRAREVDGRRCPELVCLVHSLAARAGIPTPRVYVIDSPHPNAFATGRSPEHAAVAATTGLLGLLDRDEIAAVLAHEIGHIRNRDTLIMTMTATIAGAVSMLANFGLFFHGGGGRQQNLLATLGAVFLAPFAAMIVQMAVSRTREYAADRAGAEISGKPLALASALAKLQRGAAQVPDPISARVPAAASLYIVPAALDGLFSTHPDTGDRIAALRAMAATMTPRERASLVPRSARRASALDPLKPR